MKNTKLQFNKHDNTITIISDQSLIIDHLLISMYINNKEFTIFGPLLYYVLPDSIKVGRMVVYKKIKKKSIYLVHRSNYNNYQLNHPGGHIKYIEYAETMIYSGKEYVQDMIYNIIKHKKQCTDTLSKPIEDWIMYGTLREVMEESGLNLSQYVDHINLFHIGVKTYYYSVNIDIDHIEKGPMEKYKKELYIESQGIELNIALPDNIFSSNYFNILNTIDHCNRSSKLSLNDFWNKYSNKHTHHAWITGNDMKSYWDDRYTYHINKIVDIHQ